MLHHVILADEPNWTSSYQYSFGPTEKYPIQLQASVRISWCMVDKEEDLIQPKNRLCIAADIADKNWSKM